MGFKVAWIACKDMTFDTMIADLGLKRTGRREEDPEAEFDGIALPSGWALVLNNFTDGDTDDWILAGKLDRVKADTQGLICYINETTMMSMISGFHGVTDVWNVTHDGEKGVADLQVSGTPPEPFPALRDGLLEQSRSSQGTDFVFSIAEDMGEALIGFHHAKAAPGPFEVLDRAKMFGLFRRR